MTLPLYFSSLSSRQAPMVMHFDLRIISTPTSLGHWSFRKAYSDCSEGLTQPWAPSSSPAPGKISTAEQSLLLLGGMRAFHIIFSSQHSFKILSLPPVHFL